MLINLAQHCHFWIFYTTLSACDTEAFTFKVAQGSELSVYLALRELE